MAGAWCSDQAVPPLAVHAWQVLQADDQLAPHEVVLAAREALLTPPSTALRQVTGPAPGEPRLRPSRGRSPRSRASDCGAAAGPARLRGAPSAPAAGTRSPGLRPLPGSPSAALSGAPPAAPRERPRRGRGAPAGPTSSGAPACSRAIAPAPPRTTRAAAWWRAVRPIPLSLRVSVHRGWRLQIALLADQRLLLSIDRARRLESRVSLARWMERLGPEALVGCQVHPLPDLEGGPPLPRGELIGFDERTLGEPHPTVTQRQQAVLRIPGAPPPAPGSTLAAGSPPGCGGTPAAAAPRSRPPAAGRSSSGCPGTHRRWSMSPPPSCSG